MKFLTSIVMMVALSASAHAQTPDPIKLDTLTKAEDQARAKEAELTEKRKAVSDEISDLKKTLAKSALQTRSFEQENAELTVKLQTLLQENTALEARLSEDKQGMRQLLAALQRLEHSPPPALVTMPEDAVKAAQAAQLISNLHRNLQEHASELSATLTNVTQARKDIAEQQRALDANQTKLEKRKAQTIALVERKATLQKSIETDEAEARQEVERLATEAESLRELIASLESEVADIGPRVKPSKGGSTSRRKSLKTKPVDLPKGTRAFAQAKGTMIRPITGKLLRNYGKGEKGLTYTGQSNGEVLAPYAGRIEFSGPFKNYDQVVILNVGGNYFILLTGLGDIYVKTGDKVRIGEPLGSLPYKAKGQPSLYIELRQNGKTINPVPWLEPRPVKSG